MPMLIRKSVQEYTDTGKPVRRRGGARNQKFNQDIHVKKQKEAGDHKKMNKVEREVVRNGQHSIICRGEPHSYQAVAGKMMESNDEMSLPAYANVNQTNSPISTMTPVTAFKNQDIYNIARTYFGTGGKPVTFHSVDDFVNFANMFCPRKTEDEYKIGTGTDHVRNLSSLLGLAETIPEPMKEIPQRGEMKMPMEMGIEPRLDAPLGMGIEPRLDAPSCRMQDRDSCTDGKGNRRDEMLCGMNMIPIEGEGDSMGAVNDSGDGITAEEEGDNSRGKGLDGEVEGKNIETKEQSEKEGGE